MMHDTQWMTQAIMMTYQFLTETLLDQKIQPLGKPLGPPPPHSLAA